jgi:adenylate cyclase
MTRKPGQTTLFGIAVVLLAACLGAWLQNTSFGEWFELRSYDLRFELRGSRPAPRDPGIVLVKIDNESFDRIQAPLLLWQDRMALVLDAAIEAGAMVVGFDLLLPDTSAIDPEGHQALVRSLLRARAAEVPVVLGYRIEGRGVEAPPVTLAMAAGANAFGFVNLTTDSDDFVRRQVLIARGPDGDAPAWSLQVAAPLRPDLTAGLPAEDSVLINYLGPETFDSVSFWKILEAAGSEDREFLREALGGRAVLVGIVADEDLHSTPLYFWRKRVLEQAEALPPDHPASLESAGLSYRRRTPGVEIHAHTIATLISGEWIRRVGRGKTWAVHLGLALASTAASLLLPFWAALAVAAVFLLAYLWGAALFAFSAGFWYPVVGPAVTLLGAFTLAQGVNYLLQGREKRRLRSLFHRYVSQDVVDTLVESPDSVLLKGERREVTVLFSDLRGFSTLSESLDPEQLVERLNRYFDRMVAAIHENGGMIDKFIGDAVMAVFGAPAAYPDHPRRAAQAALAMQERLQELNREWKQEGIETLQSGIGIHTGEAVVGNVGATVRLEYTAIGDAVNTASRLESLTKELKASILLSAATAERLGPGRSEERGGRSSKFKVEQPLNVGTPVSSALHRFELHRFALGR